MKPRRAAAVLTTEHTRELRFASCCVAHSVMPPHEPDGYTTISEPFSIGVSFTGHSKAIVANGSGRKWQESFGLGSCGITGAQPLHWLRVTEPAEAVMIYPAAGEMAAVTQLVRAGWQNYPGFLHDNFDPVVWATCARFRMAALGAMAMSELEAEGLVDNLLTHVAVRYLQTPLPARMKGRLDPRRLARVVDLVESRLHDPPSLREMSDAAALSRFHFQRMFRATTGLSPHAYVAARRMERARRLLAQPGATAAAVRSTLGFGDAAHFRRSYRRQFNAPPRGYDSHEPW